MKTQIIQADFSNQSNMEYYEKIIKQVDDKDIGLVVLNAGVNTAGKYELSTLH